MATKKCIVLDIETVPSQRAILDTRNSEFKLPVFHQPVCLSYVVLDNEFSVQDFNIIGLDREKEKDILIKFGRLIDDETILVTWGGRRFDLPVILYRSMYYGIPCQWYFKRDFGHRYDLTGHIDLKDHMSLFGATETMKLDHIAASLGLPGKMDVDGSEVEKLWAKNRYSDIGSYCVSDVVQTMVIFLRWSVLRGLATPQEVNNSLDSLVKFADGVYLREEVSEGIKMVTKNCNFDGLKVA